MVRTLHAAENIGRTWLPALVAASFVAMLAATSMTRPVAGGRAAPPTTVAGDTPTTAVWVVGDAGQTLAGDGDLYDGVTRRRLNHLGLTLSRVVLRPGIDPETAMVELERRLPGWVMAPEQQIHAAGRSAHGWDAAREFGPATATCGGGLRVGMLDTGVDRDAVALRGQVVVQRTFLDDNAVPAARDHGTAVATLLVGRDGDTFTGLLPDTVLYSAAVLRRRADGSTSGELGALFDALDWLIGEGVSVANMSFETGENAVLSLILTTAAERGLVLTAAAGNGGHGGAPAFPAAHPNVLAATATDRTLKVYEHATTGAYIDFAAPGVDVLTADDSGMSPHSGTSFAVPFLTAAVAMAVARGAAPDADALRMRLRNHAQDLGAPGKDETYGWGLLDLKGMCG